MHDIFKPREPRQPIRLEQSINRFEELEKIYQQKGLTVNLEALLTTTKAEHKKCSHENTNIVSFQTVLTTKTYDYQISAEFCEQCGKLIKILSRKDLIKQLIALEFFKTQI